MSALVAERRTERRAITMLAAVVRAASTDAPAQIRDISTGGAKLQSSISVEVGMEIELVRGANTVRGTVNRKRGNVLGVQFEHAISLADWLPRNEISNGQDGSDADRDLELPPRVVAERVREEIGYVARAIENAARILANDPILSLRHANSLQELAMGEQMLRELTEVLSHDCAPDAVQSFVTGPMKQRLLRKAIRGISNTL